MTDPALAGALATLRRRPDIEAENLVAVDAADRYLLDTVGPDIRSLDGGDAIAVIGDAYGALTIGALLSGAPLVRVHQDPLAGELALAANADELGLAGRFRSFGLVPELVAGARLVLLRLPRSLDALDEIAELIAKHAHSEVTVVAGGMQKHLTVAMNEVLGRWFDSVEPSLARQKARLLTVRGPRANATGSAWPRREHDDGLGLWVCAHGATFAGTRVDIGTRFLLETMQAHPDLLKTSELLADALPEAAPEAIDLGCGTGVIASWLAQRGLSVLATDQSAAAVASAGATAAANRVADRVRVLRDDAAATVAEASARLIVLNPPFHIGASVHAGIAHKLFAAAARVLAPGGSLVTVWNSHLAYRGALERVIGPTRQLGRNAKFTVTVSTRR